MTPAVALLLTACYTLLLGLAGPHLLSRLHRAATRAPGVGLHAVTALATSWGAAVVSAGLLLLVQVTGGVGLAALIELCVATVCAVFGSPAEPNLPALIALAVPAAALGRLGWYALTRGYRGWRWSARHRAMLGTVGRRRRLQGTRVWLLPTDQTSAYCVGGPGARVVLTQGALDTLDADELAAVIAHERAHLRGRHHLLLGWLRTLDAAFPGVPLLRRAAPLAAELAEWAADDQAARGRDRRVVARAIAAMAPAPGTAALAAGGGVVVERVRRLLRPARGGSTRPRALIAAVTAIALTTAAGVLLAPISATTFGLSCGLF
ncbi:M56 family metallopeptidase [Nocardiopsis gilva]|uniref:M56 family metallopeptidase n=1 Tax=Nocardiopsis gilva TaxID=280236 RepID=UPI00034A594E|nr:M56 family metallopeptidase [Nocardiopsis gilva]